MFYHIGNQPVILVPGMRFLSRINSGGTSLLFLFSVPKNANPAPNKYIRLTTKIVVSGQISVRINYWGSHSFANTKRHVRRHVRPIILHTTVNI